jgi:hypothetical protein
MNGLTIITTSIIKSLLASLCQREEWPLFEKEGSGEICKSFINLKIPLYPPFPKADNISVPHIKD